ncbi:MULTISPECIES: ricin-type beta-trefoil lectin domain protein [unclassified Streptomyces]|uniref:ricin-type beta-trefoil lectin domain protein n=1 Tax=unclassified Streptomyces TaxID=2593676 RepID=UPI0036743761
MLQRRHQPGWTCTDSKQLMVYGNKCPDASGKGSSNGTAAVIWDCNGQTNQQWNINTDGTITGVQSGLCLDAEGASTANGAKIQLWSCSAPRTSIRVSRVDSRFEARCLGLHPVLEALGGGQGHHP